MHRVCTTYIVFPSLPEPIVKSLYEKIGGVPRYVLKIPALCEGMVESGIIDQAFRRVKEALDMVKSVGDYLRMISSRKDFNKLSNSLIHRWPSQDNPSSFTLKWASTYIEEQLLEQLPGEARHDVLRYLISNKSPLGDSFEAFVTYNFRKGDIIYPTKGLFKGGVPEMLTIAKLNVQKFSQVRELTGVAPGMLCIPRVRNFPCIDLIITPNMLFQITLSKNHPLKQQHLTDIAQELGCSELKLYFVVPATEYDDFKQQNFLTQLGKVSHSVPKILQNMKQYALKVDLV